ncbi:MAG TPA: serine hydrolase domain-containing protein [Vicinamibacterales bacterium]|nr:serine hydrolase domain-containing protein [Vicinamibacterales bacterium]
MNADARRIVEAAIRERVFPCATIEVGDSDGPTWQDALGTLTFDANAPPVDATTPFDLASLTKVLATTTLVMGLVQTDALRLDERVADFFDDWRGDDREAVTIADLLEHASGLSARLVDAPPEERRAFEHDISTMRLEYAPRSRSIYSDLGFILLGFVVADRGEATLAQQFARFGRARGAEFALFPVDRHRAAPTIPEPDDVRRGRILVGEVHDNYAAALGGAAGHAGVFASARAVGSLARLWLRAARGDDSLPAPFAPTLVSQFITRSSVTGSSRALGWDTMLPTSSCGTRMSARAFGHVGYTGTSLWIDPEQDRYFVLLTNRACGGGTLDQMRDVRRAFHDALGGL